MRIDFLVFLLALCRLAGSFGMTFFFSFVRWFVFRGAFLGVPITKTASRNAHSIAPKPLRHLANAKFCV